MSNARNLAALLGNRSTVASDKLEDTGSGVTTYTSISDLPSTNSAGDMAFVDSSDRLYVSNGAGWYSVSIVNATPTIDSVLDSDGNAGPFILSTEGASTVITVTATDSDGTLITYTADADSDFGGLASLTQSTNVFTVTPFSEDSATTESGTITFKASDGIGLSTSQQTFQLSFSSVVTNANYTVALITTDGTTGDNETITDSSTNNHTVSQYGNASASSFSPYRHGGYSVYFDGSDDYIKAAGVTAIGTADFTFEAWIKPDNVTNSYGVVLGQDYTTDGPCLYVYQDDLQLWTQGSGSAAIDWTGILTAGEWQHVALVRNSGVMYLYHDGVQHSTTYSQTTSFADTDIGIGARHYDGNERFQGRISNARYVRGTAVYTGSYTVPTVDLTAVSGTELLLCNKPYIIDQSSSPKTLTLNGGVFVDPSSPFENAEYSKSDHGGSIYFDGTGDYVISTSSDFELGTSSAFSIEFWYYFVESRTHTLFDFYDDGIYGAGVLRVASNQVWLHDGSTNIFSIMRDIRVGQWEHFCWTRDSSNNHVFYINGEQVGTSTASTTLNVDTINLGRRGATENNTFMYGHISDFSLTKGSVTRSAAFTPPTSPLSSTGTTLHIKGTDSTIIDKAQGIWHIRPEGDCAGSTAQTKFADSSIYIPAAAKVNCKELNFGYGDFTIECWARSPSEASGYYGIFALEDRLMNTTATTGGLQLGFRTGNQFDLYHSDGTTATPSFTWTTNTWYHIALVRSGSTITLYVDGTSISTVTSSTNYKPFKFLTLGMYYNTSYPLLGYIEDFRLTDGLARYTSNFTAPTASLEG